MDPKQPESKAKQAARKRAKLADVLRANLKKRKDRSRELAKTEQNPAAK